MSKYRISFLLLVCILLPACSAADANEGFATSEATPPVATAVSVAPTSVSPTAPVATEVEINTGAAYLKELQTAVVDRNYTAMQAMMDNPIAVGGWRSEWRMVDPAQTVAEFQNDALPAPATVQFTDLTEEELTSFLGQTPASMFGPTSTVITALHSTGWGIEGNDEAILFITEEVGRYAILRGNEGREAAAKLYTFTPDAIL